MTWEPCDWHPAGAKCQIKEPTGRPVPSLVESGMQAWLPPDKRGMESQKREGRLEQSGTEGKGLRPGARGQGGDRGTQQGQAALTPQLPKAEPTECCPRPIQPSALELAPRPADPAMPQFWLGREDRTPLPALSLSLNQRPVDPGRDGPVRARAAGPGPAVITMA